MTKKIDKKIKFGVIVLNYFSYQDTINCIDSFKKAESYEYDFCYAIVENGSNNESFEVLQKKYENDKKIHQIKLEKNVGFANGNNVGCDYLRNNFPCDYYIFSNSDILVPKNIFSWIVEKYNEHDCDILGPDIYATKLGVHQNPIKKYTENKRVVDLKIIKKKLEKKLIKMKIINKKILSDRINYNNDLSIKKYFDCPIHGSFIITNNKIFSYYNDFFDSRTFLYMEEYLLYLRCKKNNLKIKISLDNTVTHLQGKSTDTNISSNRKKIINQIQREIDGMKIYKNALNNK